jgi:ATP-dependent 26S proteasome regulatory subunit
MFESMSRHGPPGCGKTSFITALAGELHLPIYVVNLADRDIGDTDLLQLFGSAQRHSIILLEDIDAAFGGDANADARDGVERGSGGGSAADSCGGGQVPSASARSSKTGLTFSGLLNAIDGVAAQEGKVLFMTTNHIERLDPALIRPGRVDKRVRFGLASSDSARRLFCRFYANGGDDSSGTSHTFGFSCCYCLC